MSFIRVFIPVAFLVIMLSAAMVVAQFIKNQSRHAELREGFLVLSKKGYAEESRRLYERLMMQLQETPQKNLIEDLQRTAMLVKPEESQPDNLVWKYHWSVSNELEKRATAEVARALKTARKK